MKLQALVPLLGAALTVTTCYAAGSLLIARLGAALRRYEKLPLAFVLGASVVHLAMFALFALKIAYKPVFLVFAGGVMAAAAVSHFQRRGARATETDAAQDTFSWKENLPAFGYAAIFVVFTVLYFVNAWAPEASADGPAYHLGLIARYLRAHGFEKVVTNMYAGLGEGAELLYALAFAFGRHSAGALVHLSFAIGLALAMVAYGMRLGKWWVGAGAALLVYLSPVVGRDATTAYIDVVAAAVVFSVVYWVEIWEESGNDRLLIAVGLLAGYAYATKYTAVLILLYALIVVAWRKRSLGQGMLRPLLTVSLCAAAMMLPWMVKDWIYLRDPVAPLGATIFRNANVHVLMIQEWEQYLRNYDVTDKWKLPMALTVRGTWVQGILGPVFLFAPLALFALRFRAGRRLLLAAGLVLAAYPGNIGTRFLIPFLPFVSMAIALAVGNFPRIVAAIVLVHAVISWPPVIGNYIDAAVWRLNLFPLDAALRVEGEDHFLRRSTDAYADARLVEQHVPKGERVLAPSPIADSYTTHEILAGFQGASNQLLDDLLYMGSIDGFRPKVALVFQFPQHTGRHLRILQTMKAEPHTQWDVHEVRFLLGGVELPRSSRWKVRARPNPWEVQLAFDKSPATRWRSWEAPAPGDFIEIDFGEDKTLDQVVVDTSENGLWSVKLQIEMMDGAGKWVKLAGDPEMRPIPVPDWLRRAASQEIRLRGVKYVLIHDSDYGAMDYLEDPDAWGFKVIARERDATILRIEP
jgi:hypothetical protein